MAKISDAADFSIEGGRQSPLRTRTTNSTDRPRFARPDRSERTFTQSFREPPATSMNRCYPLPACAVTGPFAGQLVGRVMDNRAVFGGSARLPANFDVFR